LTPCSPSPSTTSLRPILAPQGDVAPPFPFSSPPEGPLQNRRGPSHIHLPLFLMFIAFCKRPRPYQWTWRRFEGLIRGSLTGYVRPIGDLLLKISPVASLCALLPLHVLRVAHWRLNFLLSSPSVFSIGASRELAAFLFSFP